MEQILEREDIDTGSSADPALVVTFGSTSNRRRPINRLTTVVGRARGCDVGLEAPDVSYVHCLITRSPDGLVLRDCKSRSGTLLNHKPVNESSLADGDLIQIGPFCFKVSIPPNWRPPTSGQIDEAALDESRLMETRIEERSKGLVELQQTIDEQQRSLARVKSELADREAQLSRRSDEMALAESKLVDRHRAIEAFEQRLAELAENQRLAAQLREAEMTEQIRSKILTEELAPLKQANEILQRSLGQSEQIIEGLRHELSDERAQTRKELSDISRTSGAFAFDLERLRMENDAVKQSQQQAQVRCSELQSQLDEERQESARRIAALRGELESERSRMKDLIREAANLHDTDRSLRRELEDKQTLIAHIQSAGSTSALMQQEIARLQDLVHELELRLQTQPPAPASLPEAPADLQQYEQQLNEYRQQLEAAQTQLQQQEQELQERLKQSEMQLSRERADLAREKAGIERTRAEFRAEIEHLERVAANREKLGSVSRLAGEIRKPDNNGSDANGGFSDRIRKFLKRVGDS